MSLASKTLLILLLTAVSLVAAVYQTTRWLLLPRFLEGEHHDMQAAVQRVQHEFEDEIAGLAATASDYGEWDRTYDFMRRRTPDYIEIEYKNETLQGLQVNSVTLLDTQRRVVYLKAYDLARAQETGPSPELERFLTSNDWSKGALQGSRARSGILLLSEGPVFIAASPILTSARKGPARGLLVMTRNLDPRVLAAMKSFLNTDLAVELTSSPSLPQDFRDAMSASGAGQVVVQPMSPDWAAGYSLLADVSGRPALVIRVIQPRQFLQNARTSLHYLLAGFCIIGAVFIATTILLLRYAVLRRVTSLNSQIRNIGERRDLAARVRTDGGDELAKLAEAVNTLLDSLQQRDNQFRLVAENIHQVLWVKDEVNGKVTYVSPAGQKLGGQPQETLYADPDTLRDAIHAEDQNAVADMLRRQSEGREGEAEFRIVQPDGSIHWVWRRHFPVFDSQGRLAQTVGVSEDVTEYKDAEEALLKSQDDLWNVMLASAGAPNCAQIK